MRYLARVLLPAGLAVMLGLAGCSDEPDKPRKQQRIVLLPAAPPPPPPPPKQEEKQAPKPLDKPQETPKPAEAPQQQALKTDEAPGSGAGGGLTSGAVTQDYTDQKIGQGPTIGSAAVDTGASRLALTAYGNAASRALNEFLVRDRGVKLRDYQVRVELWLTPSGGLQRVDLLDSTGDAQTDEALRTALNRFPGTSTPPPAQLPQPMRVLVSNRLLG